MIPYVRFYEEAAARSVVERFKANEFDTGLMVEPSGGGDAVQEEAAAHSVVEQSQADEFHTGLMVEPGGGEAVQEEAAAHSVVEQLKADEFDTGLMVEPSGGTDAVQEEAPARSVVEQLKADGFNTVLMVKPSGGTDAVQKAIDDGFLDLSRRALATKQLAEGRCMVAVQAIYGLGERAIEILEAGNPIAVDTSVRVPPRNPSPLSDVLQIRTLSPLSPARSSYTTLLDYSWKPTGFVPLVSRPKSGRKSALGLPLLSRPKSGRKSALGMPLLTKSNTGKTRSFGFKLLSDEPGPLSSFFGLPFFVDSWSSAVARTGKSRRQTKNDWTATGFIPLVSRPKSGRKSALGMPLLSTPRSGRKSALGMPLLTKSSTGKTRSFGFKVLSDDRAPLSSFFGLPLLSVDTGSSVVVRTEKSRRQPKHNWTTTGFIPLLSRPKSGRKSALGMPLLSKPKKDWKRSFGIFPLLSKNPAPLSSRLGLLTLTDGTKRKEKNRVSRFASGGSGA